MNHTLPLFIVAATALTIALPNRAEAWGRDGHQIVAAIAETRLTTKTLEAVQGILQSTAPLAAVSIWADDVRPQRRDTAPWHYVDFPIHTDNLNFDLCPRGDCVTEIITRHSEELATDLDATPLEKEERLKFLVHFVGDQAQPLHNANEFGDKGGNDKRVQFFGRSANLHSIWDSQILSRYMLTSSMTPMQTLELLNSEIRPEQVRIWARGGPRDWTADSNRTAIEIVYPGWSPEITTDYYLKAIGTVRLQLQKGGIRLAHVLNKTFDPAYDGVPVMHRTAGLPAARRLPPPNANTNTSTGTMETSQSIVRRVDAD
jgi:hypothetical protein